MYNQQTFLLRILSKVAANISQSWEPNVSFFYYPTHLKWQPCHLNELNAFIHLNCVILSIEWSLLTLLLQTLISVLSVYLLSSHKISLMYRCNSLSCPPPPGQLALPGGQAVLGYLTHHPDYPHLRGASCPGRFILPHTHTGAII